MLLMVGCGQGEKKAAEFPGNSPVPAEQGESTFSEGENPSSSEKTEKPSTAESANSKTDSAKTSDGFKEKDPSAERMQAGYDEIGGVWKMAGLYYEDHLIDIKDNENLSSMYGSQMITFNGDGTFVFLRKIWNDKGTWSAKEKNFEKCYILKTESRTQYTMENGVFTEKDSEISEYKQYIVTMLNGNTFALNEYDSFTGKAKAREMPTLYVREGEESVYIKNHKTPLNGESSSGQEDNTKPSASGKSTSTYATSGERNALEKAKQYLSYTAFSYSGLVEQLEYEGYTHSQAVYGADNCGADWNEQSLKKAEQYLSYTAFSYSGLVEQLEYEGFTNSEAAYGAKHCNADWKEQAYKKARQYMEYSSFSLSELIDQLEYEGFTYEEASYGANRAY